MELVAAVGVAASKQRPRKNLGSGRRVSKFPRAVPVGAPLKPRVYDGISGWDELLPSIQNTDTDADVRKLLQTYEDALLLDDKGQKRAVLQCQWSIWEMVERNRWCDEVLFLSEHALKMAMDKNWNFLIQEIVLLSDCRQLQTICSLLSGHAKELAKDNCGCRLLCRICEQGKGVPGAMELLMELADDLLEYATHCFGNFVVVKILKHFVDFPGMDAALFECIGRWVFRAW